MTFGETICEIWRERGLLGLWAGYSASLVLTLNPSMTFFLQQIFKRALVPRETWNEPGARITFFLAAVSKAIATAVTYPFQIAKARVQVSAGSNEEGEDETGIASASLFRDTIFATVLRIARVEGVRALYDGIGGELLKSFFSHGTTMLSKDVIHRLLVQLYFAVLAALKGYPRFRSRLAEKMREARKEMRERYFRTLVVGANEVRRAGRYAKTAFDSGGKAAASLSRAT
ncbi:hypothetical protein VTK56DRAFT_3913 [Thermocarpiscus australiensis]